MEFEAAGFPNGASAGCTDGSGSQHDPHKEDRRRRQQHENRKKQARGNEMFVYFLQVPFWNLPLNIRAYLSKI
ncbi:MAG: hypothetical protein IJK02_00540 [Clostridia bacterium]|nr:hypothetical protein [Clostridia bacterium]